MTTTELNLSFGDKEHPRDIADEVCAVLCFLSTALGWKGDMDVGLEQTDLSGLALILMACESSLRRIR